MKPNGIVQLKRSFKPIPTDAKAYGHGIFVGLSQDDRQDVIVHLYDPDHKTIYIDEYGTQALYCFGQNEVKWQEEESLLLKPH